MISVMYEFSAPMPFFPKYIDILCIINQETEKSKIKTLYFSLPSNSPDFTGFEQGRYTWQENAGFDYWKPLIEYSLEKEFNFIYLLNSPKVYNPEHESIDEHLEKLNSLLQKLKSLGCTKVRVCNPQVMGYLNENYPEFELYVSTSAELHNIKQYANMLSMFNNIKEFVPAFDLNKNFKFLKNFKQRYPNIKLELMVNESCLPGCPIRNPHNIFSSRITNFKDGRACFTNNFYLGKCSEIKYRQGAFYLCNANVIYPWEIEAYSEIGINNFKLIGRNSDRFDNGRYFVSYLLYLKGVDNYKHIAPHPIRHFLNGNTLEIPVRELRDYLPDIEYFKKNGHLCASSCGAECSYCFKCAEKVQEVLDKYAAQTADETSGSPEAETPDAAE